MVEIEPTLVEDRSGSWVQMVYLGFCLLLMEQFLGGIIACCSDIRHWVMQLRSSLGYECYYYLFWIIIRLKPFVLFGGIIALTWRNEKRDCRGYLRLLLRVGAGLNIGLFIFNYYYEAQCINYVINKSYLTLPSAALEVYWLGFQNVLMGIFLWGLLRYSRCLLPPKASNYLRINRIVLMWAFPLILLCRAVVFCLIYTLQLFDIEWGAFWFHYFPHTLQQLTLLAILWLFVNICAMWWHYRRESEKPIGVVVWEIWQRLRKQMMWANYGDTTK